MAASAAIATFVLVAYLVGNPLPWMLRHWVATLLTTVIAATLLAMWFYYAEIGLWTKTQWQSHTATPSPSPGNPPGAATGLPAITIDAPAPTTPWQDLTQMDLASYWAAWGATALFAAIAALVVMILLVAISKGIRKVFSGRGLGWALLLFVALATAFFFASPHLAELADKVPNWAADVRYRTVPGLLWGLLWVALIFITFAAVVGVFRSGSKLDEKAAVLGGIALAFVAFAYALMNYDTSRHEYADTTYPSASSTSSCPGNGETKTVGPDSWVTVNAGFKCHIIFEVVGTEMLLGEPSNYITANPGDQVGNVLKKRGVRVISVKTTGGYGYLNYKLHPLGCRENGWECT